MSFLNLSGLQYFYNKYIKKINQDISALNNDLWKKIYPVGSIYLSTNNTNPGTFWGGTWVAWGSGRVPVGVNTNDSNFNTVEKTGGAASINLAHSHTVNSHAHTISHTHPTSNHTLTVSEIPGHTHGEYLSMIFDVGTGRCESRPLASQQTNNKNTGNYKTFQQTAGAFSYESGHLQTGSTGGGQGHNHGNTGGSSTSNSGSASPGTNSKLGNQSVLQPYITCYMWKRTA